MRNAFIFLFLLIGKTFAQSTTLLPNATKIGNVTSLGACNSTNRGTQVFNTSDSKMYFCNGSGWVDMTGGSGGSLTLPYSGSGSSTNPNNLFTLTNNGTGKTMSLISTGESNTSTGLKVQTVNSRAIDASAETGIAVLAASNEDIGVYARSYTSDAIYGNSTNRYGIHAFSDNNFSAFLTGRANVYSRLSVGVLNYDQTLARLHIKADGNGGWGQHIRMENGDNIGYGEILHDNDGMKFRNFQINESFIFRNSNNNTVAYITADGNLWISGSLTQNANGRLMSDNSANQQTVFTKANLSLSNKSGGEYIDSTLEFSGFSGIPTVMVAQVENGTGDWNKVMVTPFNVTARSCALRITNLSNTPATMSGTWHFTIIGQK